MGSRSSNPARHDADLELVARLIRRDERAFDDFFDDFFPRLYRFALVRLDRDPDAAEEVVQRALCKVVRKLSTYRGEAPLFSWCCTFCRREIGEFVRRNAKHARSVELTEDSPEIQAALESLATLDDGVPQQELLRREIVRLVHVTLDHLPSHYGSALAWKYIDGLPVKEIASRLELSPKAAESLLTRARAAFRDGFSTLFPGVGLRPAGGR